MLIAPFEEIIIDILEQKFLFVNESDELGNENRRTYRFACKLREVGITVP
jgi:hypothetical protein